MRRRPRSTASSPAGGQPPPVLRASRAVLGRQRPADRPALPPARGPPRARRRALLRAHPARPAPDVGNNVVLAERLGLEVEGWFGDYQGRADRRLGPCAGALRAARRAGGRGQSRAGHARPGARLIAGGPEQVGRVGIITGGAGSMIAAAREAGLDTYITGEGAHHTYFDAIEWGLNVIFAGHYATETARGAGAGLASRRAVRPRLGVSRPPDRPVTARLPSQLRASISTSAPCTRCAGPISR